MAKIRMQCNDLNGYLYSMKIIDSPACSSRFINENGFHFLLVCALRNRPRVTLQNAMEHIAPFTVRTLLYGDHNLDSWPSTHHIGAVFHIMHTCFGFCFLQAFNYPDHELVNLLAVTGQ